LRVVLRKKLKSSLTKEAILSFLSSPITYPIALKKRIERRVIVMKHKRTLNKTA